MTSEAPPPPTKEDSERLQRSPSLLNATAQVVNAAVNMERSDSVLHLEDDKASILSDDKTHDKQNEEEPYIEAMLSPSMRKLEIIPSPRTSSMASKRSSVTSKRSSMMESVGDLGEVGQFQTLESDQEEPALPPPQPLQNNGTSTTQQELPTGPLEILESCGAMPLSLPELRTLYRRLDASDSDIASALLNARQQPRENQQAAPQDAPLVNEQDEDMLLHSMFCTFSSPPPSLDSTSRILEMERHEDYNSTANVSLPKDVLVSVSGAPKASVVSVLTHEPRTHLLRLPLAFQMAFFRILIRLLTNETDAEYNQECLFTYDWIEEDDRMNSSASGERSHPEDEVRPEVIKRKRAIIKMRQGLMEKQNVARASSSRPERLYTVVRFRSGTAWNESVVTSLLNLFKVLLDDAGCQSLLAPVSRLLGLCATARIEVKELRNMLALAGRPFPEVDESLPDSGLDRLLMIRALSTAAEGASHSSLLVGKASPRHFFSFGLGHGLARTFQSMSNWPF